MAAQELGAPVRQKEVGQSVGRQLVCQPVGRSAHPTERQVRRTTHPYDRVGGERGESVVMRLIAVECRLR